MLNLRSIAINNAEAAGRALGHAMNDSASREITNELCRVYVQTFKQDLAVREAFERGYARGLWEVK